MFLVKTGDQYAKLEEIIDRENLAIYARRMPFKFNGRRQHLWEYFKMKNLEGGYLKVSFLKFVSGSQKGFGYNLLSCMTASYSIPMVGIEIAINVDPMFQQRVGKVVYEKMLFPFNVNMWDYSTAKNNIKIDVPGKLAEMILLLQNRQVMKPGIDYLEMVIPTRQISAFILKP